MGLIHDLVDGRWDDDRFLVVPPGQQIAACFDERIVTAVTEDEAATTDGSEAAGDGKADGIA